MTWLLSLTLLGVAASPVPDVAQRDLRDPTLPSDSAAPAQDVPPEVAQGTGPRGTSGEVHEDGVGYAAMLAAPPGGRWANVSIGVGHPTLAPGTPVELTALDTGRTIVALVVAPSDGAVVALSPGAAQALGVSEHAGVRVRTVVASPQDLRALQAGQAASSRLDAPPTLLAALRRKLPNGGAMAAPRPSTRPVPASTRPVPSPSRPAPTEVRTMPAAPTPAPTPVRAKPAPVPAPTPVRAKPAPVPARGGFMI